MSQPERNHAKESPGRIRVLIVDDHTIVRQGVRAFLETQPDIVVVSEAASGAEAVRACAEHAPDVVLMDLIMPEINGVEATRQIKQENPKTQVIILTSYLEDEHILPALRSGALSYLLKDVSADELSKAIRKAARREAVLHPQVTGLMVQALHNSSPPQANPLVDLSEREVEVLHLIANGLSNADIAERLVISEKTVKSHVSNILSKLDLTDRTQVAVYAWRTGIMQPDKEAPHREQHS
jgi:NarL family two-component system response regulator LiaR